MSMGSAWLGLVGAIIGGLVSLIGTLITSRRQWQQERIRWSEERERDSIQWKQQRESDAQKREDERRKDERSRDDERLRWLREQKLKCYLEALDHFRAAGELSSNVSFSQEGMVSREEVKAIVRELRHGHRWVNSLRAVCGNDLAGKVVELNSDLYFTIDALDNVGMGGPSHQGHMVPRRDGSSWILSGTIDDWSEKLSEILRTDLASN
jgi:hypothetical protein